MTLSGRIPLSGENIYIHPETTKSGPGFAPDFSAPNTSHTTKLGPEIGIVGFGALMLACIVLGANWATSIIKSIGDNTRPPPQTPSLVVPPPIGFAPTLEASPTVIPTYTSTVTPTETPTSTPTSTATQDPNSCALASPQICAVGVFIPKPNEPIKMEIVPDTLTPQVP